MEERASSCHIEAWTRLGVYRSLDLTLNAFTGPDQAESGKGDLEVVSIERSIRILFGSLRGLPSAVTAAAYLGNTSSQADDLLF